MTFGERMRQARKAIGLTQPQLAARIGCTQPMVSQYESGIKTPSLTTAIKISAALGASLDWLSGMDWLSETEEE